MKASRICQAVIYKTVTSLKRNS